MPLKMLGFILALLLLVSFVGLNWNNASDIDLWFNGKLHFEDVSIVLSFLIVYLAGLLSSIPFWVDRNMKKKKRSAPAGPSTTTISRTDSIKKKEPEKKTIVSEE